MLTRKEMWIRHAAIWAKSDNSAAANAVASAASTDLHHEYYRQFVTEGVKKLVLRTFGRDAIVNASVEKDPHFNKALPLGMWDGIEPAMKALHNIKANKLADPIEGKPNHFRWCNADCTSIGKTFCHDLRAEHLATLGK